MKSETAKALASCLCAPECVLQSVDLSGNGLADEDVRTLRSSVQENLVLTCMDLRANPVCVRQVDMTMTAVHHAFRTQDIPTHCQALSEIIDCTHRNELRMRRQDK